jgi:hypothetical protein
MIASKASDIILRLLGIATCPPKIKSELTAFIELLTIDGGSKNETPKSEPNEIKAEENTINLADAHHFKFPDEFNLEIEGQEGARKIKIFPDGVSETETPEEKPTEQPPVN